jgi:20S proteasome alpha/beta subunit
MIGQYQNGLKGMTYILGSHCVDGVVLIADRKITLRSGTTHEYEDKLFNNIWWLVVGSSGITGLFEKFRDSLNTYISSPEWENTVTALTSKIELITRELNETYNERLGGQVFDVLFGVKGTTGAVLYYVHPIGFAEGVRKYKAIGHGEPYGSFFLKRWWRSNMNMLEVAELGFFIIKYIDKFELDDSVGIGDGYPQVWLIPHQQPPTGATPADTSLFNPHMPSKDEMVAMEDRVLKRLAKLEDISWSF